MRLKKFEKCDYCGCINQYAGPHHDHDCPKYDPFSVEELRDKMRDMEDEYEERDHLGLL